jgi:hypothetical protein
MSKAYVPPHKRTVSLTVSDFPSLSDNALVKAGAGGPSYVSKASTPTTTQVVKEEKSQNAITYKPFQKEFKKVTQEEVFTKTVPDESEWTTKESKSSKKTKPDSDWDGFEDY